MKYTSAILTRARIELLSAWEWYENEKDGLGDRFKKEIDQQIKQIEEFPERYPERKKTFREATLKIFPYVIIYKINKQKKVIAIVSIFHTSRNPRKKYIGIKKL